MDIPELIEVKAFLIDISSKESIELIGCNIKTNPIIVPKSRNLNNESDIKDPSQLVRFHYMDIRRQKHWQKNWPFFNSTMELFFGVKRFIYFFSYYSRVSKFFFSAH